MKKHQFLFGCNCFGAVDPQTYRVNDEYTRRFTRLFNYATFAVLLVVLRAGARKHAARIPRPARAVVRGQRSRGERSPFGLGPHLPEMDDRRAYNEVFTYLKDHGVEIQAFGVQSHLHSTRWTFDQAWSVCEDFSRYGWPLHFTELSVLSGKPAREIDWFDSSKNQWISTDDDATEQANYVRDFYTLLFSHPAVEAISWWDMADGQWLNAPSGLVYEDLSPKPAFDTLTELVKKDWWTDATGVTDDTGSLSTRGFCGRYVVTAESNGKEVSIETDLFRDRQVHRDHEVVIRV